MPLYEYECVKCGKSFELLRDFNSSSEIQCPFCGAAAKKIISSGIGFIFKGSGFYKTDYKDKPAKSCEKKETKCESCPKKGAEV
ncbi:zinc ribbon domain-containing protein [candidate division WOR-3 bacterium]|nr:zinc ribbon domain-containing protein [candidate division WOR-3 bacterium]